MNNQLTRQTYDKRLAKQFLAEREFLAGKSNQEVCDFLNMTSGKIKLHQVEVMRNRWQNKKQKLFSSPETQALIGKSEVKKSIIDVG